MATKTLEQIDASLARWKTRLRRAMTAIDKLEKQRKRLVAKKPVALTENIGSTTWPKPTTTVADIDPPPPVKEIDTSIPSFLRRTPDPVAEQIKQEQAETKRKKAQGRIAKMKAKQAGDLKRMPLTGKAALAAIRSQ